MEIVRFASLVYTPEGRESFKAKYNILARVTIEHCLLGEWHTIRPERDVVIPMIAFIKGRMQILMGKVTRDFFISHRLCSTQCSPNLFRILGKVDVLNRKMGVNLTIMMSIGYITVNIAKIRGTTLRLGFPR